MTTLAVLLVTMSLSGAAQSGGQGSTGEVLASVNGKTMTSAEVEKSIAADLAKLEQQIYDLKKAKLDGLIEEQLIASEAARRGVSPAALIDAEVNSKQSKVTDEEVAVFYGANQARLQKDLNAWRDQIRTFLNIQKATERKQIFVDELRKQGKVEVLLKGPPIFRAEIPAGAAFTKGPADAPITLVEYGDFHCHFCKRVQPTLTAVLAKYGTAQTIQLYAQQLGLDAAKFEAVAGRRRAGGSDKAWLTVAGRPRRHEAANTGDRHAAAR